MNPGGRGVYGGAMRSMRRDDSVTSVKIAPGTLKRIAQFAAPYKWILAVFMVLVIVDAAIGAVNPLIFRVIIDEGILHKKIGLIEGLAFLVAGLAIADAALTLGERLVSARVEKASYTTCGPGCSPMCRACRSPSSRDTDGRSRDQVEQRRARRPTSLH